MFCLFSRGFYGLSTDQLSWQTGIQLDTALMEACLLQEKLDKCQDLLSIFLRRRKVTLQEIQSLTGLLNFAYTVVVPGRAFLRRLIDLSTETSLFDLAF